MEPWFARDRIADADERGVALVLSSGAARGFAHVGVLKVLEANGLRPDMIVGCSAGSVHQYRSGEVTNEPATGMYLASLIALRNSVAGFALVVYLPRG